MRSFISTLFVAAAATTVVAESMGKPDAVGHGIPTKPDLVDKIVEARAAPASDSDDISSDRVMVEVVTETQTETECACTASHSANANAVPDRAHGSVLIHHAGATPEPSASSRAASSSKLFGPNATPAPSGADPAKKHGESFTGSAGIVGPKGLIAVGVSAVMGFVVVL